MSRHCEKNHRCKATVSHTARVIDNDLKSELNHMLKRLAGASTLVLGLACGSAFAQQVQPNVITPPSSMVRPGDAGVRAHTNYKILQVPQNAVPPALFGANPMIGPPGAGFYETPASLACIYAIVKVTPGCNPRTVKIVSAAGSKVIAIVDAFDNPTILTDLKAFSTQFGLPQPTSSTFQVVFASGQRPFRDDGWGLESALDVQMAHALAPKAKVILVEAESNSFSSMLTAEKKAAALVAAAGGGEVSNSWGSPEFGAETSATYVSPFVKSKVVFFASSGDSGTPLYPAVLPQLIAAGGTTINRTASGVHTGNSAWGDSGAGPSQIIPRPSFQSKVSSVVGSKRGIADISAVGNPNTGVWVRFQSQWYVVGGTSVSSPVLAAIANVSGHFATNNAAEEARIYGALGTSALRDIKNGKCGYNQSLSAKAGYDFCGGVGSPQGKNAL